MKIGGRPPPGETLIDVYRLPWVPAWRTGGLSGPPPRECAQPARLTGAFTGTNRGPR
ncbi:hypothetical protein ABZ468_16365 [Streptomyces sp. NPDC005708]|uniref:hypothetical protein n=1 Tax=unclassified Streptomyces TaxID=2593676 RepID=UPI0033EC20EA